MFKLIKLCTSIKLKVKKKRLQVFINNLLSSDQNLTVHLYEFSYRHVIIESLLK